MKVILGKTKLIVGGGVRKDASSKGKLRHMEIVPCEKQQCQLCVHNVVSKANVDELK